MMRRVGTVVLALGMAAWSAATNGMVAHADGDNTLGPTLYERAIGLGVASAGVGLAGRIAGGGTTPVPSGTITLSGIPAGAEIRHAYLYWATYGEALDTDVTLDGTDVTGALIGTAGPTCWVSAPMYALSTSPNRTYRADVTALVDGDGDYVVSGVASGEFARDAQGASLVVVYVDPSETLLGTAILRDGSAVVSDTSFGASFDFDIVEEDFTAVSGALHLGVGDGQTVGLDGTMSFRGTPVDPTWAGLTAHFDGHSGNYWDANVYDLTTILHRIDDSARFHQNFQNDCLAYAYVVLTYQTDEPAPPDAGVDAAGVDGGVSPDAGGLDAGGLDGGGLDGGGLDGGGLDASGSDAGPTPVSTGGCGCRATSPRWGGAWLAVFVLLALRRRRAPRP